MKRNTTYIRDCIDIALMQDNSYVAQLEQLAEDLDLGIAGDVLQETVEDIFIENKCSGRIHSDDVPQFSFTPVDEAANEYMDAYYEVSRGQYNGSILGYIFD